MSESNWSSIQSIDVEPGHEFPKQVHVTNRKDWLAKNTSGADAYNVTTTDAEGVQTEHGHVPNGAVLQPNPPIFHPLAFADFTVEWSVTENGADTKTSGVSTSPDN